MKKTITISHNSPCVRIARIWESDNYYQISSNEAGELYERNIKIILTYDDMIPEKSFLNMSCMYDCFNTLASCVKYFIGSAAHYGHWVSYWVDKSDFDNFNF